jgi:hypothetical protein
MVHNTTLGHSGVEKTIQRLKDSGNNWNNMRQHVKHFIEHFHYAKNNQLLS